MRFITVTSTLAVTALAIAPSNQQSQPLNNPSLDGSWHRGPGRPDQISNWTSTEYLLNYISVLQTVNSYPHYYDLGNYQAVGNLYTSTGCAAFPIFNKTVCGPDAIAKFNAAGSKKQGAPNVTLPTQHSFTNPDIRFDADGRAYVAVYLNEAIYGQFQDGAVTQARGFYTMLLEKVSDGPYYPKLEWLISQSEFRTFFPPDGYPNVPRPNPGVYAVDSGAEW